MRRGVALFCCFQVVSALCLSLPVFAAEPEFAIGLGIDYATGDYDTDVDTDSIRVPLTIDYFPTDRLSLELVIPYLYQSSSTTTTFSGGLRLPTREPGGMNQPDADDPVTVDETKAQHGLGDISLSVAYTLLQEQGSLPALRPILYLKFPSADEEKGLGTGEFDIGGGLSAVKWVDRWYTFVEGRYIRQGDNSDLELRNYGTLEGETGYQISNDCFASVGLWWSSSPAENAPDVMEGRVNGIIRTGKNVSVEAYIGQGLSEGTADFLSGLSVFYRF